MGITAELKGLIDRAQYILGAQVIMKTLYFTTEHTRHHKGIFISTAGLGWENVFDAAVSCNHRLLQHTGFEYWDNVIANDLDRYGGMQAPHRTRGRAGEGAGSGRLLRKLQAAEDAEA